MNSMGLTPRQLHIGLERDQAAKDRYSIMAVLQIKICMNHTTMKDSYLDPFAPFLSVAKPMTADALFQLSF